MLRCKTGSDGERPMEDESVPRQRRNLPFSDLNVTQLGESLALASTPGTTKMNGASGRAVSTGDSSRILIQAYRQFQNDLRRIIINHN